MLGYTGRAREYPKGKTRSLFELVSFVYFVFKKWFYPIPQQTNVDR
jgi:hypothetical protein